MCPGACVATLSEGKTPTSLRTGTERGSPAALVRRRLTPCGGSPGSMALQAEGRSRACRISDIIPATGLFRQLTDHSGVFWRITERGYMIGGIITGHREGQETIYRRHGKVPHK